MAASSPLPRWAPTPSPTRPLRSSTTDQTAMSSWNTIWTVWNSFGIFRSRDSSTAPPPTGGAPGDAGGDQDGSCDHYEHNAGGGFDGIDAGAGEQHQPEEAHRTVFLAWEDITVTAAGKQGSRTVILDGLTAYARPGEVLALMGPSGCGKTTLLDTLAGRLGSNMKATGDILINGRREKKLAFGTSAYVTQDDLLMATLTVTEAVRYAAQLQLPDTVPTAEKRARADRAIKQMGLGAVAGHRIGGRVCRGISGGQRRRVSICMEMLASPALAFLDEPTSGLDGAAALHVVRRIARLARAEKMTVIAAVHQPSGEVFELFDRLCLLAYGRMVYFGPASEAIEYFDANGFPCPLRRNPSDYFLTLINKDFEESNDADGCTLTLPSPVNEVIETLVDSMRSWRPRMENEVSSMGQGAHLINKKQATFFTKSVVLTRRSLVNMHRDKGYYWLRFVIYIALCLSIGTIFFNVGHNFASIQARASMIMFTSTFITMMSIGGFPSFVEDMKIFRKEQLNGHYGATLFAISNTLSSTPYLGIICVIPGAIAYYLTGLQRGIDHFVYFATVLWACTMLVEGLMMIVAAIMPDFLMGIITGSGIQGLLMLNAGFFRLPSDLPKIVWRYPIYYMSYHKYATQGLYKNEFVGLVFEDPGSGGLAVSGEYILRTYLQVEMGYSKWVDLALLLGMVLIYRVLFLVIIKAAEILKPQIKCLTTNI